MSKTIYVGNLPFSITETELRELFEQHGTVNSVKLITNPRTGRSRGFGFVEMDDDEALTSIKSLDGSDLSGRALRVSEAKERGE